MAAPKPVNREDPKTAESERLFAPYPFWSFNHKYWNEMVEKYSKLAPETLRHYPLEWVKKPFANARAGLDFLNAFALNHADISLNAINSAHQRMPSFQRLLDDGTVLWGDEGCDPDPCNGFRMVPEWAPMKGVHLSFPVFFPPLWKVYRDWIRHMDHVHTFLRVPDNFLGATAVAWLEANGIARDSIVPLRSPLGDIWCRDCSPLYGVDIYSGEPVAHQIKFAGFSPQWCEISPDSVANDDKFFLPAGFRPHRCREIKIDGGNLLTNGEGTYLMTRRVLIDNAQVPNLYAKLEHWLGADRLILIDMEPGDELGHLNNIKIVGPKRILIAHSTVKDSAIDIYLRKIRKQFEKMGWDVVDVPFVEDHPHRVPMDEHTAHGFYANSLFVNGRIILPTYDLGKYDDQVVRIHQDAFPEYDVRPIDGTILANAGGIINCASKEIPDPTKLRALAI